MLISDEKMQLSVRINSDPQCDVHEQMWKCESRVEMEEGGEWVRRGEGRSERKVGPGDEAGLWDNFVEVKETGEKGRRGGNV
jgi:hypothetical protein